VIESNQSHPFVSVRLQFFVRFEDVAFGKRKRAVEIADENMATPAKLIEKSFAKVR